MSLQTKDYRSSLILRAEGDSRKSTDVLCTVISALFALAMFIIACIMWDKGNFQKRFSYLYGINNGGRCTDGSLYFENSEDTSSYKCLKTCPFGYYDESGLCIPTEDTQRWKFQQNPQIATLIFAKRFIEVLIYTTIISLGFGLIKLVYVNLMPRKSVYIDFIASLILLLGLGILLLVMYDRYWRSVTCFKIIVAVVCFLLALIIFNLACMYCNQFKLHGIFLEYAVLYLNQHPCVYFYIPLYILLSVGLVALITWQHCCYTSKVGSNNDFFNFNNSGVLGVLNIIQLIWGVQFLRDSFHFCVSGNATEWYWKRDKVRNCYNPYNRLLRFHWGSVAFGSFLNGFFMIPSMIADVFRCHPNTFCSKAGQTCFNKCFCYKYLFDLVRTDVYPYINFSGLTYCDAAKQCRRVCERIQMFVGLHSPIKNYRFVAHAACVLALFIISWFIQKYRMSYYGLWNYGLIILVSTIVITWFIDIYADTAQALQTCFFCERELQPNYENMLGLHPQFKDDLQHRQKRVYKDGNC